MAIDVDLNLDGEYNQGEVIGTITGTLETIEEDPDPPDEGDEGEVILEYVGSTTFNLQEGEQEQLQAEITNTYSGPVDTVVSFNFGETTVATTEDSIPGNVENRTVSQWIIYNGDAVEEILSGDVTQISPGDYPLEAVLESGNVWEEQTTQRGTMTIGEEEDGGTVTLNSVDSSSYTFEEGTTSTITANVSNTQSNPADVTIGFLFGNESVSLINDTIAAGEIQTVSQSLSYTEIRDKGIEPGDYSPLRAVLESGAAWDEQTAQNDTITIEEEDEGDVTLNSVHSTTSTFEDGHTGQVAAQVENTHSESVDVTASFDFDNQDLASASETVPAGETQSVFQNLTYTEIRDMGFAPGDYTLNGTLESGDSWSEQSMQGGTVTIEEEDTTTPGDVRFELLSGPGFIGEGDDEEIDTSISNTQSEDADVTVSYTIGGEIVDTANETIPANSSEDVAQTISYLEVRNAGVEPGDYSYGAILQSGDTWDEDTIQSSSNAITIGEGGDVTLESITASNATLGDGDESQLIANVSNTQFDDVNVTVTFMFEGDTVASADDTVPAGESEAAAQEVTYLEVRNAGFEPGEYLYSAVLESGDTWEEQTIENGVMTIEDESGDDYVMQREHKYTIESTGSESVQYYLEAEDGANFLDSPVDGSDNSEGSYWVSSDETKVAGEIPAGSQHGWEFDTTLLDAEINGGSFTALVNDQESSLEYFPYSGSAGDYWKYYFPWNIDDEPARDHWYSIEATGSEPVEYYIEKENTGGGYLPSTQNNAVRIYDDFWIDRENNGTKAAGIIQPGDTHAFEFDGQMLDVDVRGGSVYAEVDGSESSLDIYPQPEATGDGWKDPALWTDNEEAPDDGGGDPGDPGGGGDGGDAIGGGEGYSNIVTSGDYTATTVSELESALSSASSGETVFVPGDAQIDAGTTTFDVPGGVTLASNRGENGSDGAFIYTDYEGDIDSFIRVQGDNARVTGLRIRGGYEGYIVRHDSNIGMSDQFGVVVRANNVEVDNCTVSGFSYAGISNSDGSSGDNHYHHNYIYDCNKNGVGYGVAAGNIGPENPLVEYNYFNNCRHAMTSSGSNYGYVCQYNHFGPTQVMTTIDIHDPGSEETYITGNIVESTTRTFDDNCNHVLSGFDSTGGVWVEDNWLWNDTCMWGYDSGAEGDVHKSNNTLGEDASVEYSDFIDNHPGTTPW